MSNNLNFHKVLVGVSGGVDSSVAVDLLKKQGLEVEGVVIRFSNSHEGAVIDAKKVSDFLGIKLHTADVRDDFNSKVILPFCKSYCDGSTPNPCVLCNPEVKFKTILNLANELGIGYIATGHYAQVEKVEDTYYIKKAISPMKDQSYMLHRVPQEISSRLILPLGSYEKPEIRQKAKDTGLFTANKPDSQEICFIPSNNHAQFIESMGFKAKDGNFISPEGKIIKKHLGVHHYTIGQRKGLNVALGKPCFVKEILDNGDVKLAYAGDEYFKSVVLSSPVYPNNKFLNEGEIYTVKVRSASKGDLARVIKSDADILSFEFLENIRAVAKGQSLVVYNNDLVIAGGFIKSAQNA